VFQVISVTIQTGSASRSTSVELAPPSAPPRRRGPDRCVSARRLAANRLNCRRSTGPRTAAGKAVVRLNALRHGLDAAPGALLPGEDPAERDALASEYREDLRPATPEEEAIIDRMAETAWLERRAEAAAFAAAEEAIAVHGPGTDVLAMEFCAGGRGPFLRAEAWSCRLTGRFLRLARQFDRARRAARDTRDALHSRGTKPLSRDMHPCATPGRSEAQRSPGPEPAPLPKRPRGTGSGPALASLAADRRGAVTPARNEAIARTTTPARSARPGPPIPSGADWNSRSDAWIAGNKAIAPFTCPVPAPFACPTAGNKAIDRPAGTRRLLAQAVSPVATQLTRIRRECRAGTTAGAAASAAATPRDQRDRDDG
jgi:hypothetical protein